MKVLASLLLLQQISDPTVCAQESQQEMELSDLACKLDSNETLRLQFYKSVRKSYGDNGDPNDSGKLCIVLLYGLRAFNISYTIDLCRYVQPNTTGSGKQHSLLWKLQGCYSTHHYVVCPRLQHGRTSESMSEQ